MNPQWSAMHINYITMYQAKVDSEDPQTLATARGRGGLESQLESQTMTLSICQTGYFYSHTFEKTYF